MHPKELRINDYTYDLPEERIAKYPLPERDAAKLLIYRDVEISEDVYRNVAQHIPKNSLLVFNNTKVIPARVFFRNSTGEHIEVFCLEPAGKTEEITNAMAKTESAKWLCMVGRAGKWKESKLHQIGENHTLTAEIYNRMTGTFKIEFTWTPQQLTFAEILVKAGKLPIPPYLNRDTEEIDSNRYQTIYALKEGSVAAPTAGLHFTDAVFAKLKAKGVKTEFVTLHVGAATFKPVKSDRMEEHEMHGEVIDVKIEMIETLLRSLEQNIIAVGTTSLRTIETLYLLGAKAKVNPASSLQELEIRQWDAYELKENIPVKDALKSLLAWLKKNNSERLLCKTHILIAPPYKLKIANALITNFHQPNSTLLLLVAAVADDDWKKIYNYALEKDFRFLSYGDGSLLWAKERKPTSFQKLRSSLFR